MQKKQSYITEIYIMDRPVLYKAYMSSCKPNARNFKHLIDENNIPIFSIQ